MNSLFDEGIPLMMLLQKHMQIGNGHTKHLSELCDLYLRLFCAEHSRSRILKLFSQVSVNVVLNA